MVRDRFSERQNMNLLFDSDIVNLLLKTNGVRNKRPSFVIFVIWSALTVSGWVVAAWDRRNCLGLVKRFPCVTQGVGWQVVGSTPGLRVG